MKSAPRRSTRKSTIAKAAAFVKRAGKAKTGKERTSSKPAASTSAITTTRITHSRREALTDDLSVSEGDSEENSSRNQGTTLRSGTVLSFTLHSNAESKRKRTEAAQPEADETDSGSEARTVTKIKRRKIEGSQPVVTAPPGMSKTISTLLGDLKGTREDIKDAHKSENENKIEETQSAEIIASQPKLAKSSLRQSKSDIVPRAMEQGIQQAEGSCGAAAPPAEDGGRQFESPKLPPRSNHSSVQIPPMEISSMFNPISRDHEMGS
ncbi:hypothetical protein DXG01_009898 [Tephrocybe rancida]|nr:hypothetical protein DXG01_009898 [Tephrocybe rancida]